MILTRAQLVQKIAELEDQIIQKAWSDWINYESARTATLKDIIQVAIAKCHETNLHSDMQAYFDLPDTLVAILEKGEKCLILK